MEDDTLHPCVGLEDPTTRHPLRTNYELWLLPPSTSSSPLVTVQVRAPATPGRQHEHAARLVDWLRIQGAREVILLTSATSLEVEDEARAAESGLQRKPHPLLQALDESREKDDDAATTLHHRVLRQVVPGEGDDSTRGSNFFFSRYINIWSLDLDVQITH